MLIVKQRPLVLRASRLRLPRTRLRLPRNGGSVRGADLKVAKAGNLGLWPVLSHDCGPRSFLGMGHHNSLEVALRQSEGNLFPSAPHEVVVSGVKPVKVMI